MAEIVFSELFDTYLKNLGNATLLPEGKPRKHVVNANDLKSEIGRKTILKEYDETIDVVQILGTRNRFSGMGNVVIVESQGYKIQPTPNADREAPTSPL